MKGWCVVNVNKGDVVQVKVHDSRFAGVLFLVDEVREWGVLGFAFVPTVGDVGVAPRRIAWFEIQAHWRHESGAYLDEHLEPKAAPL
jgi:hypothetical protein